MRPAAKASGNKPAPKKRKKAGPYKMPDPLPAGEVLTDLRKKQWSLGPSVGKGGFGEIYLAFEVKDGKPQGDPSHVIKIEPHENGPLFCELHFYQRAAKPEIISAWKKKYKLKHLGVPNYIGSGQHEFKGKRYRFLVMERFGEDLWRKFVNSGMKFTPKVAFTVGIQLVDALEYLHAQGYVHADIKGSNILLGFEPKAKDQVFLVDFGLASKYKPGDVHRECKPDPKKAHDGTLEYTSIGAHEGISPARKDDFEILGYNLVQWMSGSLPWAHITNEVEVQSMKVKSRKNRASFLKSAFKEGKYPTELLDCFTYVDKLTYEEEPNYSKIKGLFKKGIESGGGRFDGKLQFEIKSRDTVKASKTPRKQSPKKPPALKAGGTPRGRGKNVTPNKQGLKRESDSSEAEATPAKKRARQTGKTDGEVTSPGRKRAPKRKGKATTSLPETVLDDDEGAGENYLGGPKRRGRIGKKNSPSGATARKVSRTGQSKAGAKKVKKGMVDTVTEGTQTSPGLKGLKVKRKKAGT